MYDVNDHGPESVIQLDAERGQKVVEEDAGSGMKPEDGFEICSEFKTRCNSLSGVLSVPEMCQY